MDLPGDDIARLVALAGGCRAYPAAAPYSPGMPYPEYPWPRQTIADAPNAAYDGVRRALTLLGLDAEHIGTASWNPMRQFIRPGDTVVLKPNFVREFRESSRDDANCLVTHGSVIRAVLDYVVLALGGTGRVIVADAPQNDADFDAICRIAGLRETRDFFRDAAGFDVEVYDLRPERADKIDGVIVGHTPLPGDPAGYVRVNLGRDSAFHEINDRCALLYGSEYDMAELHSHQHDDIHEYLIARTVLDADVVISLPKLKTHKKVGLTVNMKNLVGINGNKNWLPHYRVGSPDEGGDQFCDNGRRRRMESAAVSRFKAWFPRLGPLRPWLAGPVKAIGKRVFGATDQVTIRSGNWYGNDTAWRMVLDLNRVLRYADSTGALRQRPTREFFSVVDGIIAGEGNGPLDPIPKPAGLILAGSNALAVDFACARLMGFDRRRLPVIDHGFDPHPLPLASFSAGAVELRSGSPQTTGPVDALCGRLLDFKPHVGWIGHVEIEPSESAPAGATRCAG